MNNNKKVIGLIGGMGPFAGARFLQILLEKSAKDFGAKNGDEFPEIILDSVPVPDFISNAQSMPQAREMLISRIEKLNKFGCTTIAMVCNTGHVLFPELSTASGGKMVSLIDSVRDKVIESGLKRVGILATRTSLKSGLYQNSLAKVGILAIKPDDVTIEASERVIRSVIANNVTNQSVNELVKQTGKFIKRENLDGIVLGCTELPLAFPRNDFQNVIDCLDVFSDKLLSDFLKVMIEINEMRMLNTHKIFLFDMDGTLYQHDGENGTFKNSTLYKKVIENSIEFVINKENCGFETASKLVQQALVTDTIGVSNFMAKRYGITRADFFDIVWNMDPEKIIKNPEIQVQTVNEIAKRGKRLFLLTGAPRVWMENVLKFLDLGEVFERKFNGEMFGKKDEIFESLAKEFNPNTIISIGDQFETDLKPARALGMSIFEVKDPTDLQKLI